MLLDVLIPYYGDIEVVKKMVQSVLSTKEARKYIRIVLVDNCSEVIIDDDFIEKFPVNVKYIRNSSNIGRIENWNKALEYVESKWYCFLFLGDMLLNTDGLINKLIKISDDTIVATKMNIKSHKTNKSIGKYIFDNDGTYEGNYLINKYLGYGLMPWGPLQTNIFPKSRSSCLRFDPQDQYYADIKYIIGHVKTTDVTVLSSTHLEWLVDPNRTHFKQTMADYIDNDYSFISQYLKLNRFNKLKLKIFLSIRSLIMIRHYGFASAFDAIIKLISR